MRDWLAKKLYLKCHLLGLGRKLKDTLSKERDVTTQASAIRDQLSTSLRPKSDNVKEKEQDRAVELFITGCWGDISNDAEDTKSATIDDCVRWHILLGITKEEDEREVAGDKDLGTMIMEKWPCLAFENPAQSDVKDTKFRYKDQCSAKLNHMGLDEQETPFRVAAESGPPWLFSTMVSEGGRFYEEMKAGLMSTRPGYCHQGQCLPFSSILHHKRPGGSIFSTPLTVVATAVKEAHDDN
ncbi:hypothetical protein SAMD00023353_4201060 [Rosellinia necatrix]|uniref:Uncharacterized protein n=1 Tax=Rosellinia necatrix TaxID=77044 RepID=A0A1W2TPC8_ROSNE|nr:hypothetical protein SAMD00023353_4201060 [Rosellinia necatrix]